MGTDHAFAELGLPPDATEREVKAAWRRLVSQWHPDRNASASAVAKIQRINQAFEAIRRSRLDAGPDDTGPEDVDAGDDTQATPEADTRPPRPPIRRKVKLTLEEAAAGCIKVLRGKVSQTCAACEGAGHQVLGGNCRQCGGSGAVTKKSGWFGWPGAPVECDACLGGGIARRPCPTCNGNGKLDDGDYKVQVRIPHGVRDGDLLHVDTRRSRPNPPPADVEIAVQVLPHAFFQLDDDGTVRCEMPVDGFTWIANRTVQVPTLTGWQMLQLNRDRLSHRFEGQGFPTQRRGVRGDLVVTLLPVFPAQLSTDQNILLDQLIATSSEAAQPGTPERKTPRRKRSAG